MPANDKPIIDATAKDLINLLAGIIRTSQIHDPSNVAVVQSIDKFIARLNNLVDSEDAVMLELVGEYFYLNDNRIKVSMEHLVNFDYLVREFKRHSLGSITFQGRMNQEMVQKFLKAFIASVYSPNPFEDLEESISDIPAMIIGRPRKIKEDVDEYNIRRTVKKSYFNAVSFTKGVMQKIQSGEKINARKAKRVVQSMVDLLLKEEELLLGMTAIKDYDDYTYHHCVNVSILAMALGQRLGFSKQALLELGMVALFHDIGKTEIPAEVLNKPGSFTEEEWKMVRRHPYWGVRAILNMKGFDLLSIKGAIVAFEHHLRPDMGGYPKVRFNHSLDLFSRIVSLCDQYDGMTSARVYSRSPMTPEKALSLMMERSGSQLDPLLFKFFINMVGVFPVGTAVLLDTKELALVYSNNQVILDRPKVLIITDPMGHKIQGFMIDLTEKTTEGMYKRTIHKTLDPAKFKINLAEYLL
jgi:HD-GYP domain-containing protein (c-di-GMP phosphodiesterase class II)